MLYRQPKSIFQDSTVYGDMLTMPPVPGAVLDGTDDAHPLLLLVKQADFEAFAHASIAQ
jgi:hypothetical protein